MAHMNLNVIYEKKVKNPAELSFVSYTASNKQK